MFVDLGPDWGKGFLKIISKNIISHDTYLVFQDWELIVVDNNSKDGTKELINSFNDERINLALAEGVMGYLPQKDFLNSSADLTLEEGIELEVIIANISSKDREIILSLRALEKQEEKSALRDNAQKNKEIEDASKSNIGDLIKAEIEDSKAEDE